ncbi:hypothetical protein BJ138DRAFT_1104899 [Hygrophoropsis aurantiaca]|uniref:Uncharacterized protein n=1 Tax=Hygrophoropsis aurantiaca TaxID=72124 RepID=A0ACB8A0Q4_9AGAM|nr:hypothetical protein BJ138DRAFT_1104899 [Hygrophoropsis aurantiaca]
MGRRKIVPVATAIALPVDPSQTPGHTNMFASEGSESQSTRRQRRPTLKVQEQVNIAEAKKAKTHQKWKTAAIRSRQELEEINDFASLGPESEQDDDDEEVEPATGTAQAFTFKPIALPQPKKSKENLSVKSTYSYTNKTDVNVHPTLTRRSTHIPSPAIYVPQACKEIPIDPVLLTPGPQNVAIMTPLSVPRQAIVHQSHLVQHARRPTPSPHHMENNGGRDSFSPTEELWFNMYGALKLFSYGNPVSRGPVQSPTPNPTKRPASLFNNGADGLQVTQKVKLNDGGSRGRVRAGDFDKIYQSILLLAISHYRAILVTVNPYPSGMQAQQWAGDAWAKACRSKGVLIDFDEDAVKLIRARESNIRGDIKRAAREFVKHQYAFLEPTTNIARRANRKLVAMLTDGINLTYKDPVNRKGPYQHPIIQHVINKCFYNKSSAEGITLPGYFKDPNTCGFPFAFIVTIVTTIQAAVEEFSTGEQKDAQFTAEKYSGTFAMQYGNLEQFHKGTAHADLMPNISRQMLKAARRFAKVPEESAVPAATKFTAADFASAVQDWIDDDDTMDSGEHVVGEDGDDSEDDSKYDEDLDLDLGGEGAQDEEDDAGLELRYTA